MLISENWSDALNPIVKKWFFQGYQRRATLLPTLFNVQGSQRAYEEVSGVGAIGIDMWNNFENTGVVSEADFDQGYKATFTHREYPVKVGIRRKLMEDNNFPEIFNMSQRIGDSAALKRETDGASVFNNAFSASFTGADGVSLCSASHPFGPQKTGSLQSNTGTLSLSKASVRTTREAMMAFTDDNGNKMAVMPDMLIVPPALEDDAIVIAQSLQEPDSANNAVNPQAGRWKVQPWHYLTDSNNWFMADSTLMKMMLEWFDRSELSINPMVEDKTIAAHWIAYMRYSYGWSGWQWVFGHNVA